MTPFAIAGLQLEIARGDNLAALRTEIEAVVARFPWVQMVVLGELSAYESGTARAEPLGGRTEQEFCRIAQALHIWLVPGSFHVREGESVFNLSPAIASCSRSCPMRRASRRARTSSLRIAARSAGRAAGLRPAGRSRDGRFVLREHRAGVCGRLDRWSRVQQPPGGTRRFRQCVRRRLPWRRVEVVALLLLLTLDLVSTQVTTATPLMVLRFLHGVVGGTSVGVGLGVMARTAIPDRAFGMLLAVQMFLPGLAQQFGSKVLFLALTGFTVVTLFMLPFLAAYPPREQSTVPIAGVLILSIAGTAAFLRSDLGLGFIIANVITTIAWSFLIPYFFGMCADFDPAGQSAALARFFSKMGLATGPSAAALRLLDAGRGRLPTADSAAGLT